MLKENRVSNYLEKLISKIRWKFESSPQNYTIDLESVCEFICKNQSPNIDLFKAHGIVAVKNLFSTERLSEWANILDAKLKNEEYTKKYQGTTYWMSSIADIEELHETVFDPNMLKTIESLIGKSRRFVGHDSVTLNYSVPGHHDDQNSHRELFATKDYPENFSTIRTLFYLGHSTSAPQRFGFIPGSHLRSGLEIDYEFAKQNTVWLEVSHGTVIFFDPRLIHTASPLTHTKRMIVGTYDIENEYTRKIFDYTAKDRQQGAQITNTEFWAKLSEYQLTPGFLSDEN